jgi:hypothetical protein
VLQCCPLRDSPSTPVLGLMAEISSCGARPCTAVFGLYLVCAISECTRTLRQAPAKCNNSVCCLGGLIIATAVAVPWLRPSVSRRPADLSPQRPEFGPGSVHVSSVADKVSLRQVCLQHFGFPCQSVPFHQCSVPIHHRRYSFLGWGGYTLVTLPRVVTVWTGLVTA